MTKYVIESEHSEDECAQTMEELLEKGKDVLSKFVFACKSGEHIGWAYVDAINEIDALEIVPEFIRDMACVHEVEKVTPEQLEGV